MWQFLINNLAVVLAVIGMGILIPMVVILGEKLREKKFWADWSSEFHGWTILAREQPSEKMLATWALRAGQRPDAFKKFKEDFFRDSMSAVATHCQECGVIWCSSMPENGLVNVRGPLENCQRLQQVLTARGLAVMTRVPPKWIVRLPLPEYSPRAREQAN